MKKLIIIMLSLIMVFCFTATSCSGNRDNKNGSANNPNITPNYQFVNDQNLLEFAYLTNQSKNLLDSVTKAFLEIEVTEEKPYFTSSEVLSVYNANAKKIAQLKENDKSIEGLLDRFSEKEYNQLTNQAYLYYKEYSDTLLSIGDITPKQLREKTQNSHKQLTFQLDRLYFYIEYVSLTDAKQYLLKKGVNIQTKNDNLSLYIYSVKHIKKHLFTIEKSFIDDKIDVIDEKAFSTECQQMLGLLKEQLDLCKENLTQQEYSTDVLQQSENAYMILDMLYDFVVSGAQLSQMVISDLENKIDACVTYLEQHV